MAFRINMKMKRNVAIGVLFGLGLGAFSFTSSYVAGILATAIPLVGTVESLLGLLGIGVAVLMIKREMWLDYDKSNFQHNTKYHSVTTRDNREIIQSF